MILTIWPGVQLAAQRVVVVRSVVGEVVSFILVCVCTAIPCQLMGMHSSDIAPYLNCQLSVSSFSVIRRIRLLDI